MPHGSNPESVPNTRSPDGASTQLLLRRCIDGSPKAWRELHRTYYPLVHRFALGMGVDRDALPDVVQEVFIQVFRYLNRFKGDAAFKTWLYRICLSQVGRIRRRQRLRAALELVFRLNPSAAAVPAGGPLSEAVVREAEQAVARLKPQLREVFVMFEIEGLDGAEIATILKCPAGTVRRRLFQARRQIEGALTSEGASEPRP